MKADTPIKPTDILYERFDDREPQMHRAFYAGSPNGISGYGYSEYEAAEDLHEREQSYARERQARVEDGYYSRSEA
jgi:hypothetical protein